MSYSTRPRPTVNAAQADRRWRRLVIVLLLLGATGSANAQTGGGHSGRQRNQPQTPQQSVTPTPPQGVPEPWPRLDVGALLCKSRDDLIKYQTLIADGASAATAIQAADCHTVEKQTGIQLLDTDGLSRTHIVTTDDSKETGWTNAYLPSTPPASVAHATNPGK